MRAAKCRQAAEQQGGEAGRHAGKGRDRAWRRSGLSCAGEVDDKAVLDAALINAAQAAEHYEIVRYGSLIAWARQLGRNDCAAVLQKTLDEEKTTDKKLTSLAEGKINMRAAS